MHSRERVLAALHHQPTDRAPRDYSALAEVNDRLIARLGLRDYEELLQFLQVDMRRVGWFNYAPPPPEPDADGFTRDLWGVRVHSATGQRLCPFDENTTVADVEAHPWPSPDALDYSEIHQQCAQFHDDYVTYGAPWCPFFHEVGWLIGQETYFIWMHTKPEVVEALTRRMVDYEIAVTQRFLKEARGLLDVYYVGNDFGSQRGLVISPEMWERFLRPSLRRFYDLAHDYDCLVMQHSCGAIRSIIPQLIADGVDLLDPIQVRAEGMALEGIYRDFGPQLILHGGVDTQHLLPHGTPDQVRAQVRAYRELTRDAGGYLLTGSQDFIADIPDENILAMYEATAE
jgi:uroporphyrinogen decarboxylase